MKPHDYTVRYQQRVIFSLTALCVLFVGLWTWETLQPKGKLNCNSFGSYEDVFAAFIKGASYLDRDKDGIPCNSKYDR